MWKNFDRVLYIVQPKYVIQICVGAYRSYTPTCYYVLFQFFLHHDVRMNNIFLWAYSAWNKLFFFFYGGPLLNCRPIV